MNTQIENLKDTIDLWKKVSSIADFNSKTNPYDEALLDEIKKELGFDAGCNISAELAVRKTSPEQLLAVLLKVMKPFSSMLNDLYKMFEDAGAQYSDNNIQIKFDFEDAKENFDLNLDNFRDYVDKVEKVINFEFNLESYDPWEWVKHLEAIRGEKLQSNDISTPEDIQKWLNDYENNRNANWKVFTPKTPQSGVEEIDELIKQIWELPKEAIDLYRDCYKKELERNGSVLEKSANYSNLFYGAENDLWIKCIVENILELVSKVKILQNNNDSSGIENIVNKLKIFINSLPILKIQYEKKVKEFLDILNLPVWKKRYALYSAWVVTQIVSASKDWTVKYNVVKGALSFSFGGSVIAHLKYNTFDIELHAELRSEYDNPIGEGRTEHIQPDYSLCINGKSNPENNTILVVECKQYKHPSKKNFTEAIVDYAGGRPNAQVILVNYTKIPDAFLSSLPKELVARVPYFDILCPDNVESCDSFKKAVRNALSEERCFKFFSTECCIELVLDILPQNMNLILEIVDLKGQKEYINFDKQGKLDEHPYAHFNGYILNENYRGIILHDTIKVTRILSGYTYKGYVYNNSDEEPNGEISVSVKIGKNEIIDKKTLDIDKWTNSREFCVFRIEKDDIYIFDECYNITKLIHNS